MDQNLFYFSGWKAFLRKSKAKAGRYENEQTYNWLHLSINSLTILGGTVAHRGRYHKIYQMHVRIVSV